MAKNIVFLFSDQQRQDTVSAYGQVLAKKYNLTPNLDKLAKEGTRFNRHHSNQPVCGPARACVQTGVYPSELGCQINDMGLPLDQKTIAEFISEAGYETAYVGKWHLASYSTADQSLPGARDYRTRAVPAALRGGYKDFWLASDVLEFTSHGYGGEMFDAEMNERKFDNYRVDATTDFAIEYLEKKHEKPFFLFVSYIEPHHQNDHGHFEGPSGEAEKYKDFEIPEDLKDTVGDWREEMPDYLACCASLDKNVGRIVDCLKKKGIYEDTIVMYSSDHSCHFRTRNSEYKRSCHDNSTLVPMIATGGPFKGGHVVDEFTALIDLAPTFLSLAGVKPPFYMMGKPMQDILLKDKLNHEDLFIQISESDFARAIRDKKYLYCARIPLYGEEFRQDMSLMFQGKWSQSKLAQAHNDLFVDAEFYDLEADPHQKNNLIAEPEYASIIQEYRRKLSIKILEVEGVRATIKSPDFTNSGNN